ncbi:MAG: SURF1 family protein [Pseudohongiellaceae bacterium]
MRSTTYTFGSLHLHINWLVLVCVLMAAAGFVRLGIWQLDRAGEKVAAQVALEAELAGSAEAIESISVGELRVDNDELQNRYVMLEGEYVNERTILLMAEFSNEQIGYGVVTPFRLQSSGQLVLVSRGWTTGILPPDTEPSLYPVLGPVRVGAQIHLPDPSARLPEGRINPNQWPLRMRNLNVDAIAQILGEPLFPFEVRLIAGQAGTLVRHWPAVNPDVNQHLFYALQWFFFAALVLLGALFAASNLWPLLRDMGDRP